MKDASAHDRELDYMVFEVPFQPKPGNIQGQAGQVSEQPDLAEDGPAHCRSLDWITF